MLSQPYWQRSMLSVILPVLVTGHCTTTQATGKPQAPAPCATCTPLFVRPLPRSPHASNHLVVACCHSRALGSCPLRYCSNDCSNHRACYGISTLASSWVARMNIYGIFASPIWTGIVIAYRCGLMTIVDSINGHQLSTSDSLTIFATTPL